MKEYLKEIKLIVSQFLLLLVCYFICRTAFILINYDFFPAITAKKFFIIAVSAFRFDIATIAAVNSLYVLLRFLPIKFFKEKQLQTLFLTCNIIAFTFEISDWAYFSYNQKRANADVLKIIGRKADFLNQLPSLLTNYWYIPLAIIALSLLLIFFNKKILKTYAHTPQHQLSFAGKSIGLVLVATTCIIMIRGGVQYVPIGIRNAIEATNNEHVPIVLNTPFSILYTWNNAQLEEKNYYSPRKLKTIFDPIKKFNSGDFRPKNVVIIILESWSKEFTGLGGMKSYTPFFDSLMQQSFVCENAFANGYRSAEGIPAILSGIPSLQEEPFTTSQYGANRINSIVHLLGSKGYKSTFYHGGTNGTMSFTLFAKNAGFERYVGRTEYNNDSDYDGNWGIWDEPFLQFCSKDISTNLREPFVASIFTVSSHPPYKVPKQYQSELPDGTLKIHKPISYTDVALRHFFETCKKEKWYSNTLFVLVSDHCSPLSENDYYHYKQGRFAIPIIYFSPNDNGLRGNTQNLTQQIDILPSVMDYLGYNDSFFAFGNSIFSPTQYRYTIQQWSGNQLWTMNTRFLKCNFQNPEGMYDTETDKMCEQNLLHQTDSLNEITLMRFRAFNQSYNDAMINNKLWVK